MKNIGIPPQVIPDATFGMALLFNSPTSAKRIIDATWANFNDVHMFSKHFSEGGTGDELGFVAEFGETWVDAWSSALEALNGKCGIFAASCPCPQDATWCTGDPCRVTSGHAP